MAPSAKGSSVSSSAFFCFFLGTGFLSRFSAAILDLVLHAVTQHSLHVNMYMENIAT